MKVWRGSGAAGRLLLNVARAAVFFAIRWEFDLQSSWPLVSDSVVRCSLLHTLDFRLDAVD
jgi:hypothetical protein